MKGLPPRPILREGLGGEGRLQRRLEMVDESRSAVLTADADDYIQRGLEHLWVHTQQWNDLAKPDGFMIFTEGEGIRVRDITGRSYIDAMSGLWVVAVGHGRAELADVAAEQMRKLAYINTFAYATRP